MLDYTIRRFQIEDAEKVAALIRKTIQITNAKDYSKERRLVLIGAKKMKAVCSLFLFCLNIREKV